MTNDRGFSLVEAIVAMGILATGLLGMAGIFTLGLAHMSTSSANLVAREKAREAVESVHTARDTRTIRWCQIYNVGATRSAACSAEPAAVFLAAAQPMYKPGVDGLVNTADDAAAGLEEMVAPGPDGLLGTSDDMRTTLTATTREVTISDIVEGGVVNPSLRQIVVVITYRVGQASRTYTLTTYISSIS